MLSRRHPVRKKKNKQRKRRFHMLSMRRALIHRQYKRSTKARMKSWDDAFRYFMQVCVEMRGVVAGFVVVVSQETKRVWFVGFVCRQKSG